MVRISKYVKEIKEDAENTAEDENKWLNISDFLFELLNYANDEDIKTFLCKCIGLSPLEKYNLDESNNIYKRELIRKIIEYFYYKEIALRKCVKNDVLLIYKHLYYLSQCYYSYPINTKNKISKIDEVCKHLLTEKNVITNKDKEKFIKILIDSYIDKGFYYYFDDELVKIAIDKKGNLIRSEKSVYTLKDINNETFIINSTKGINVGLGKFLPRICNNELNDNNFIELFTNLMKGVKFQDLKIFHCKIMNALTENKREICKCCNPNLENERATKICENCINLINELNTLKLSIDAYEPNLFIRRILKNNFKDFICSIKYNDNISITELRKRRKTKLKKFINKLEKEIDKAKTQEKHSYTKYENLLERIKIIKPLIDLSFKE